MSADVEQVQQKSAVKSLEADIKEANITVAPGVILKNDARKHPDETLGQVVATMSLAGFTVAQVCSSLRMSAETLMQHYRHEYETGGSKLISEIAGSLAQRAKAGSDTAAIFLLKTRGGGKFTERQQLDVSVEVTHKAELVRELATMIGKGKVIEGEAVEVPTRA